MPLVCLDNPSPRNEDSGKGILESDRPKVVYNRKKVRVPLRFKVEGVNLPRRPIPKCYHCGKMGHIRPHCHQLRSSQPKRGSPPPRTELDKLVLMIKDVVSKLDKLEVSQDLPRENMNMLRRRAITHPLRESDKRPT